MFFGSARVRLIHAWSSTPSVISTRSFTDDACIASELFVVFSENVPATSMPPHTRPASTVTMPTVFSTPAVTRRRPSVDMARGLICWGMSLQLRAGAVVLRGVMIRRKRWPRENDAARVKPFP